MANQVLVYSDKTHLAAELMTAARQISSDGTICAFVLNDDDQANTLATTGARVYSTKIEGAVLANPDVVAHLLVQAVAQTGCNIVLLASDRRGKLVAGRLAQKLGAACLSNVSGLKADGDVVTCTRNVLGGAAVAEQRSVTGWTIVAVSPKSYAPASAGFPGSVATLSVVVPPIAVALVSTQPKEGDSVDVSAAEKLIVVGQGLESQSMLEQVNTIAERIGAVVGCTKPVATDKGWLSEDRIVGISGKTCKPDLAVLLGVSGQVQFYAGIRDAKVIASVNNSEAALIVGMADYNLIADLGDVLPQLAQALKS